MNIKYIIDKCNVIFKNMVRINKINAVLISIARFYSTFILENEYLDFIKNTLKIYFKKMV